MVQGQIYMYTRIIKIIHKDVCMGILILTIYSYHLGLQEVWPIRLLKIRDIL